MSMSISEASVGRLTATGWLASTCRWWVLLVAVIFSSTPLLASQDNDLLDLESGALVLSATTQYEGERKVFELEEPTGSQGLR
jgi:hypothetical protein